MAHLDDDKKIGEIVAIRAKLRSNESALRDLRNAISDTLNKHGIDATDVGDHMILCVEDELNNSLNEVILPGGTNCAAV